jgi:hypothetical protein
LHSNTFSDKKTTIFQYFGKIKVSKKLRGKYDKEKGKCNYSAFAVSVYILPTSKGAKEGQEPIGLDKDPFLL